jgi:LysM repeat protein
VKSIFSTRRLLIILIFVLAVVLSACERPADRDGEEVPASPTSSAIATPVQPGFPTPTTAPPVVETPAGGAVDPQPTTDPTLGLPTVTPLPGAVQPTPAPPVQTGQVTYVVTAGDTLFSIARSYNLTVEQVAAANNIDPNGLLVPRQTLIIPVAGGVTPPTTGGQAPGERTHVVVAGDNLFRIGLRYGFTVAELASYNGIANPHLIYVGQVIRIPPGGNP